MSQEFRVNLERFNGPYIKLLELIEERRLSINEFSLSEVTDKYLEYIRSLENRGDKDIIDISKFITVAATLMLIKAKSLFPNLNYTIEEEYSIVELEKKLELYQSLSKANKLISSLYGKKTLYNLSKFENRELVFVWDERVSVDLLHSIAIASLIKIPKQKRLLEVAVKQVIKIEEVIEKLMTRVQNSLSLSFRNFSTSLSAQDKTLTEKKTLFIVSFLAMLELIKNGVLMAEQGENYDEIKMSKFKEVETS